MVKKLGRVGFGTSVPQADYHIRLRIEGKILEIFINVLDDEMTPNNYSIISGGKSSTATGTYSTIEGGVENSEGEL